MKNVPLILVAAILAGYAANLPASNGPRRSAAVDQSEKPPSIGMSKEQVLARCGGPKKRTLTDKDEQWVYLLNFGEAMGRALIPFSFKGTPIRTAVIVFGPDGRVKKYNGDTPTDG